MGSGLKRTCQSRQKGNFSTKNRRFFIPSFAAISREDNILPVRMSVHFKISSRLFTQNLVKAGHRMIRTGW